VSFARASGKQTRLSSKASCASHVYFNEVPTISLIIVVVTVVSFVHTTLIRKSAVCAEINRFALPVKLNSAGNAGRTCALGAHLKRVACATG
jgi:hypothetical protein